MRISFNWLAELVELPKGTTPALVAERLTATGLEVEAVEDLGAPLAGVVVEVERVLHVARGVVARNVERLEVVEVVLDLRAFRSHEPERREHSEDVFARGGQRVRAAALLATTGKCDVEALSELSLALEIVDARLVLLVCSLQLGVGFVRELAGLLLVVDAGQLPDALFGRLDEALLSEVRDATLLELVRRRGVLERTESLLQARLEQLLNVPKAHDGASALSPWPERRRR